MLQRTSWTEFLRASSPHHYLLLVSSVAERINLTGISWFTIVSWEPQLVAVSLRRERYGYELLQENGDFTLAFPAPHQLEQAIRCGRVSGKNSGKVRESGFNFAPAASVRGFILEEAAAALECRFEAEHEAGDHRLIIARVLACQHDPENSAHIYTTGYSEFYSLDPRDLHGIRG
jgi:flavin reductase (DIM6/NTAB) family NADH-FMN oxidoreductase RutF